MKIISQTAKKIRLLLIAPFFPPYHSGGYELRCRDIMHELEQRGHIVKVISSLVPQRNDFSWPKDDKINRVLHQKSQSRSVFRQVINDLEDMRFIRRQLKDFKPDLVYLSHMGDLSNAIIPYFSSQKLPFLYDEGGIGLMRTFQIINRGLYFYDNKEDSNRKILGKKIVTALIDQLSFGLIQTNTAWPDKMYIMVNSHATMKYAIAHGVPAKNFEVIHSGIDLERFPFSTRVSLDGMIKILVPGRIVPIKNSLAAVLLLKVLRDNSFAAEMVLVGKVADDSYYEEIQTLVNKLDLEDSIKFKSMTDQDTLSQLYRTSDFCFFPSRQEFGLSRVPLEAMASGALVISYGGESSNEIIEHKRTGLLVEEGALSQAADWIVALTKSREKYFEIRQNARVEVEKKYSLASYVDQVESYLNFILEGRK